MKRYIEIRKCLYKQLKMLAEATEKDIPDDGMSRYSSEMIAIYKELYRPFRTIFFSFFLLYLGIHFLIFVKKLFWS